MEYFNELWDKAEDITDFAEMAGKIRKVIRDEGVHVDVTPYEAYALVLKNYLEHRALVDETPKIDRAFALPRDPFTDGAKYRPLAFQKDAVNQALSILKEYNGVIIADVVGLGKSVIGSVLGCVMDARRGIVVAPPGLVGSEVEKTGWCGYLDDFKMYGWRAIASILRYFPTRRHCGLLCASSWHVENERQMTDNVQMLGNAELMTLPKTAFLSSRKVAPQDVMRCYDWATGVRDTVKLPLPNRAGMW